MRRLPLSTVLFFATIFGLPLAQAGLELARGESVQALQVIGPIEAARLRAFEDDLHEASFVHRDLVPHYQHALFTLLQRGNEKVIVGRGGWLYYAQDVEHVTGPGVLAPGEAGPVAVETLTRFRDELAARDVELLLVPVPTKAAVHPEHLSRATGPADNPDTARFLARLADAGLEVLDVAGALGEPPTYLPRDTHWTPRAMEAVAQAAAARARRLVDLPERADSFADRATTSLEVAGTGDIVEMLNVPPGVELYDPMPLHLRRVVDWQPEPAADVLLLGDSFTRVFSDPELGMGEGAGFAEHLSLALGRPLDVIAMSGGGAAGVRTALARRERGLAGKRLVIWEFTLRDLSADPDSWRWIDLPPHVQAEPDSGDAAPEAPVEPEVAEPSSRFEVTARVTEVSVLDPDFDYAFCLGVFEYEVLEGDHEGPLWVALPIMVEHEATPAAALAVGARQRLVLEPIEDHYDLESTSWIDDTDAGWDIFWAVEQTPVD